MKDINYIFKPKSSEEVISELRKLSSDIMLIKSVNLGFLIGVKDSLHRGANIHKNLSQALRYAVINGHYEIVKYL